MSLIFSASRITKGSTYWDEAVLVDKVADWLVETKLPIDINREDGLWVIRDSEVK